jgi:hypothetical protein
MKKKILLQAGIILTILVLLTLVLPTSTVLAQQTIPNFQIVPSTGFGIGIKADITNIGPTANYIPWTITMTGGWPITSTMWSGTIALVNNGDTEIIGAHFWGFANPFGFGIIPSATFTITVGTDTPVVAPQTHLFIVFTW